MRLQLFVVLAIAALFAVVVGHGAEPSSSDVAAASMVAASMVAAPRVAAPRVAAPLEAPMSLASAEEPFFGCGETRCTRDSDCPSTCGGCITWSGTCALFQPR